MASPSHFSNAPQTTNGASIDDERWYVALGGSSHAVTLKQLDDAFQRNLISADTLVWQEGMDNWLPLRVVAGIEPEPPKAQSRGPAAAPSPQPRPRAPSQVRVEQGAASAAAASAPTLARTMPPSRQPATHAVAPAVAQAPSYSAPPQRTAAAPAHVTRPSPAYAAPYPAPEPTAHYPQVAAQAAAYAQQVAQAYPAATPYAPQVATQSTYPSTSTNLDYAAPQSLRPYSHSYGPEAAPRSRFGSFVFGVALLASMAITLHRNDVLRGWARAAGQESSYLKLERQWLGSPGFGTPRSVENVAQALEAQPARSTDVPSTSVSVEKTPTQPTATTPSASNAPTAASASASSVASPSVAPPTPAPPPERNHVAAPVAKPIAVQDIRTTRPANPVATPKKPLASSKPTAKPQRNSASISAADLPLTKPNKKRRGDEYDPLNSEL